ncbi:MAG: PAS domain S-box protein [Opitutus sp.]
MISKTSTKEQLRGENAELRARLEKAEAALRAEGLSMDGGTDGSALQRAEAAGKRENFLQRLIEVTPSVVHVFDLEQQSSVFINRTVASVVGYRAEEIAAMGDKVAPTLMHPDDLARFPAHLDRVRALRDDEVADFEHRMRDRAGEWHWFHSRDAVFARDAAGAVRQLIGTAIETTARRKAEAADELYRLLLKQGRDILLFFRPDGVLIEANAAALAAYGYSREELLSKTIAEVGAPETQDEIPAQIAAVRHVPISFETVHVRRDGTRFPVEVSWTCDRSVGEGIILSVVRDISERRQVEEKLRESEAEFRVIFEQSAVGMVQVSAKTGRFIRVNAKYCAMTGYSAGELAGMSALDLDFAEDRAADVKVAGQFLRGEIPSYEAEKRYVRKDGKIIWVHVNAKLLRDADGHPERTMGVIQDITARKQAEETIARQVREMDTLYTTTPAGLFQFDADLRFVRVNDAMAKLNGLPAAQHRGRTLAEVLTPELAAATEPLLRGVLETGQPVLDRELHGATAPRSEEQRDWLVSYFPVRAEGGGVVGVHGVVQEITARKQAEQALRTSEHRMRLAMEAAATGMWDWDLATNAVTWSPECCVIHGLAKDEFDGTASGFDRLIHLGDRDRVWATVRDGVDRRKKYECEFRVIRPDGEVRWVTNVGRAVYDEQGRPLRMIGTITDVTERKVAEERLRASEEFNRTVLESSPDCVKVLDGEGRVQFMNANGRCLLEVDDFEAMRDQPWLSVWPEAEQATVQAALARAKGGEAARFQAFALTAKGTPKWWDVIVAPSHTGEAGALQFVSVSRDITEQREAAEKLRASEERFRVAIGAVSDILWTNNAEGEMTGEQRGWGAFTGQLQEDYQGYGWSKAVHPEDAQPTLAAWKLAVAEKQTFEFQHRVRRYDGQWRLCSIRAEPLLDSKGGIREWVGVHTDITDQRHAERAVRDSEERFRVLATAMPQLVWACSSEGACTFQGPQWVSATGQSCAEALGYGWLEMIHPDDRERTGELWQKAVAEARTFETEYRLRTEAGTYRWFLSRADMIKDAVGTVQLWIGTSTDIEEAKRTAALVQENETRLRLATEATAVGIWEWNVGTGAIHWDAQMFRIYGIAPRADGFVQYSDWSGTVVPEDLAENERIVQDTVRRRGQSRREFRIRRREDGEVRDIESVETVRTDEHGQAAWVVGTNLDITERKRGEESLRRATEEVARASKAKDDFLAALSHELRTPLTPVLLSAAALRDDHRLPSEVREQLSMMERNIALEARLIDDLLDLTTISRGKLRLRLQPSDAHSLISLALEIVRESARDKGLVVECAFNAKNSTLQVDAARFQQVVWNLLRNAVKFTPVGGTITLTTRDEISPAGISWLHVEVADTGIGIELAHLAQIFQPFEQGANTGSHHFGGLGLGLAIARSVVELHGGRISAQSAGRNRGATFVVQLPGASTPDSGPLASDTPLSPDTSPDAAAPRPTVATVRPLHLLVVEDHESTLVTLAMLLRRDGHHVVTAANSTAARVAAAAGAFDLVISDLGLPDGTGIELMSHLRSTYKLSGIALSGYGMEEDVARSQAAGFVTHLVKPVAIADLRRALAAFAQAIVGRTPSVSGMWLESSIEYSRESATGRGKRRP